MQDATHEGTQEWIGIEKDLPLERQQDIFPDEAVLGDTGLDYQM